MYIYSSLWVGDFFIFLLGASNSNPLRLYFKEHEEDIRSRKAYSRWKEKVYLYPAILQRKWMDYKFRDKFIAYTKYDNILPIELTYPVLNPVSTPLEITMRSSDKSYKQLTVKLLNAMDETILESSVKSVIMGNPSSFSISVPVPGAYSIAVTMDGTDYRKTNILFFKEGSLFPQADWNDPGFRELFNSERDSGRKIALYCSRCKSRVFPMDKTVDYEYVYKNYIPLKAYLDIDGLGSSFISDFIMHLPHSGEHKKGLVHLLNMLRLASIEDEITIVTNLFKDDPQFAYFITNRLFLFSMIPIMESRELQKILSTIDDEIIAKSLSGESRTLVKKVMENISKRRGRLIEDMMGGGTGRDNEVAKEEMHRIIKSYFEESVGRVLKIPEGNRIRYTVNPNVRDLDDICSIHGGDIIAVSGHELFVFPNLSASEGCTPYDAEVYKNSLFTLCCASESTIFLKSTERLKKTIVHIYDWRTNIEYCEIFEQITQATVIPLRRVSSELILTIGAIDSNGRPREQVLRLKLR